MIDPKTDPGSEEHETIERYDLEVAPRVRNLPPYLFGESTSSSIANGATGST